MRGSKMENYVAKTILSQIQAGQDAHGNSGRHMMMCWGFQKPWGETTPAMPLIATLAVDTDEAEGRGFLEFTVNGALFAGKVRVTLAWDDTYTIQFVEHNENCITVLHNIYFDELANVIDRNVENAKNV